MSNNTTDQSDMGALNHIIIRGLIEGDENAYRYIFENYYVRLCTIAYQYVNDDFLAKTIVSDTIYNMWEKRDGLNINLSLSSYLVRSVRNRCLNHLRQKNVRVEKNFSSFLTHPVFDKSDTSLYPSATLLEQELESEIKKAIDSLPDECRRVFIMSRFEEKKYDEIASELNISVNTVKYHIKRALFKLHEDLSRYIITLLIIMLL